MRKPIIAGNWKMFKTRDEALFFIMKAAIAVPSIRDVDTVICAQAPLMRCLIKRMGDNLRVGAQNLHWADEGAYTGEVSGPLLKSYNVDYVVVGHSERRKYCYETDEIVNQKTIAALRNGLTPIVCVGEVLDERTAGVTNDVLRRQITKAFVGLEERAMKKIVVAYEPVWAIGTGKTATASIAEEACAFIRSVIAELFGASVAEAIRIQYGGSVNPKNIDELLAQPDIDGALIGGASLDPDQFITMAAAALKRVR
ncbi:MAG TPA: triose-phosphate isomerase [Acholeplasmatales bacterium]|nr:MAG: triose-phosphate isomerase [Tenericutes bacterium GWF2_57_13]HAQ56148.1 triose-phosphate isomerase [Acholeplasmatales bacterium]